MRVLVSVISLGVVEVIGLGVELGDSVSWMILVMMRVRMMFLIVFVLWFCFVFGMRCSRLDMWLWVIE